MSTTQPYRILLADDEPSILEIIKFNLDKEGYEIFEANNGLEAIEVAIKYNPDLIILDMMMPKMTGKEACLALRKLPQFSDTIIVFLTAMNDEQSEIDGLVSGADDYITKPVSPNVLITKINAWFRRLPKALPDNTKNLEIDRERFLVRIGEQEIVLAKKEFELMALLVSKPGKVFLRNEILSSIWGTDVIVGDRTIDVHIRKIRQKLNLDCITTVKGVGYKFDMQEKL